MFSRFWNRLKVLEDKFALIFVLKPLVMQEMQFSVLHHLHQLSGIEAGHLAEQVPLTGLNIASILRNIALEVII